MKIIKGTTAFRILTPINFLKQQLLIIERAGRTCYQSEVGSITYETAVPFIRKMIKSGHHSVIEHSILTVKLVESSRGLTHEQVRHRIAAYSQESTRYVDYAKAGEDPDLDRFEIKCVVPPHRDEKKKIPLIDGRQMSMAEMLEEIERFYRGLRKAGWRPEDARQILPQALKSEIVISANFREWRHIVKERTQFTAHWEIRMTMCHLLDELRKTIPVIFEDFVFAGVCERGIPYYKQVALA